MDFESIFSFILYIATFILGFALDHKNVRGQARRLFVVWLYIFLCFGYMTGSDWRSYELDYDPATPNSYKYMSEPLSLLFLTGLPNIIGDFWLAVGVAKCVYLSVLLRLLKKLTPYYLSSVSILLELSLSFMLISNPLRYMLAMIPVTIALTIFVEVISNKKVKRSRSYILIFLLLCVAMLFHNASLFFFVLFPIVYIFRDITHYNRLILLAAFIVIVVVSSNVGFLNSLKDSINLFLMAKGDIKEYSTYTAESNNAIFSVGNIFKMIFLCFVLYSRDYVSPSPYSKFLYSITIAFFFFDRILLLIPTGFRLVIPLTVFYAVYIVNMFHFKRSRRMGFLLIMYLFLAFSKNIWFSYDHVPYSNSIPHIITQEHLPYIERSEYNFTKYVQRTGRSLDYDE